MQLNFYNSYKFILVFTLFLFSGCVGYKFEKSVTAANPTSTISTTSVNNTTPVNQIRVMVDFPDDKKYVIIGECYGSSIKGAITGKDGSYSAFKRLRNCACLNGGNAVVITNKEEKISSYTFTTPTPISSSANTLIPPKQEKVKLTGTVIYILPNESN